MLALPNLETGTEQGIEKPGRPVEQFALCQWMQPLNLHAPRERVGKHRHQHHVCGSGQQEPTRLAVAIDRRLQGNEYVGDFLDLVQYGSMRKIRNEAKWIGIG